MLEKYKDAYESMYGGVRFIDNFQPDELPAEARAALYSARYKAGDRVRRYSGVYDHISRITACKNGNNWTVCYWLKNSQYPYYEHELRP